MGWKTLCCVRPKVVDQRESPPIQAPTNSSHKTAELQAAHTPGGRTLLVTAQSGSAREFEGYVRPSSVRPGLSVPLQLPCGAQSSKDTQADGVAGCNQACSAVEAERPAVSSYSCPVGDMQRPPGSLLEASVRRRNRAGRPQARQHAGLKEEESLDNQQLTTIMRFMSVYKGQLDGTSFQLVEEMSPLLADGLVLRAHDGKIYNGRDAALRRLQHGADPHHDSLCMDLETSCLDRLSMCMHVMAVCIIQCMHVQEAIFDLWRM